MVNSKKVNARLKTLTVKEMDSEKVKTRPVHLGMLKLQS